MDVKRTRRPSPAFVVAMIALFVALGGTAGAVATQAVPLAKRALVADNAKKLGGKTSAQLTAGAIAAAREAANAPGPASTAVGLVTYKSQPVGAMPPGNSLATYSVACDAGQKAIGGGMSSDGAIVTFDSYPKGETAWEVVTGNFGSGSASITIYAICLR